MRVMDDTFYFATSFNQHLPWDLASATTMNRKPAISLRGHGLFIGIGIGIGAWAYRRRHVGIRRRRTGSGLGFRLGLGLGSQA